MTNLDPALEKFIAGNEFYATDPANDGTCEAVSVSALEDFMAGKRIVEDVPVAWRCEECPGIFRLIHRPEHITVADSMRGVIAQPLYAAPSGKEVGNG